MRGLLEEGQTIQTMHEEREEAPRRALSSSEASMAMARAACEDAQAQAAQAAKTSKASDRRVAAAADHTKVLNAEIVADHALIRRLESQADCLNRELDAARHEAGEWRRRHASVEKEV